MSRLKILIFIGMLIVLASGIGCWSCSQLDEGVIAKLINSTQELVSPLVEIAQEPTPTPLPLKQYSIDNLRKREYQSSPILLTKQVNDVDDTKSFSGYNFSFQTLGKKMTGWANIPSHCTTQSCPVVILVRGYATPNQYYSGFGTKNAASVFASRGYITLAPDFFGFGNSDPEPENSWEARFIKPINIIELIKSIQDYPKIELLSIDPTKENTTDLSLIDKKDVVALVNPEKIKLWAHSNGGQIALSILEIIDQPIPASLWAPVSAPFPYSILFFTGTNEDEGKEARAWLALFERDYDVFEFSISQHLALLSGPIQIHHGSRDTQALQEWSDTFVDQIKQENKKREKDTDTSQEQIMINYYIYPDADHNLQPSSNWSQAIQRDLDFFEQN